MASATNTRKRLLSNADESAAENRKRPRLSLASSASFSGALSVASWLDRLPKPRGALQQSLQDNAAANTNASNGSISAAPPSSYTRRHRHVTPAPSISRASSFTAGSRAPSPGASTVTGVISEAGSAFISRSGMALMRSVSSASLRSASPSPPAFSECSAKYHLRHTKSAIDFSLPPSVSIAAMSNSAATNAAAAAAAGGEMGLGAVGDADFLLGSPTLSDPLMGDISGLGGWLNDIPRRHQPNGILSDSRGVGAAAAAAAAATAPASSSSLPTYHPPQLLSCSSNNVLFFSRGNRVHFKNILLGNDEVGQLCKLGESHGDLQIIACAGPDQPDIVALGTTTGVVQIWDAKAKKKLASWSTKGVSAMRWNAHTLTLGGHKGTIRHYDTRISPPSKMKEQARKVTRHQARITSLAWNVEGTLLASGDESGTVYCWDARQKVPLDVGEFVQRRKKMQHEACVRALAWCPWQPKLLASADDKGVVRLWNINTATQHSNAVNPGRLDLGAAVTGLHFSPHCKELLTTHGASTSPNYSSLSLSTLHWNNHSNLSNINGSGADNTSAPTTPITPITPVMPITPVTPVTTRAGSRSNTNTPIRTRSSLRNTTLNRSTSTVNLSLRNSLYASASRNASTATITGKPEPDAGDNGENGSDSAHAKSSSKNEDLDLDLDLGDVADVEALPQVHHHHHHQSTKSWPLPAGAAGASISVPPLGLNRIRTRSGAGSGSGHSSTTASALSTPLVPSPTPTATESPHYISAAAAAAAHYNGHGHNTNTNTNISHNSMNNNTNSTNSSSRNSHAGLSLHLPPVPNPHLAFPTTSTSNCISVFALPALKHVTTLGVVDRPIEASVLVNPGGRVAAASAHVNAGAGVGVNLGNSAVGAAAAAAAAAVVGAFASNGASGVNVNVNPNANANGNPNSAALASNGVGGGGQNASGGSGGGSGGSNATASLVGAIATNTAVSIGGGGWGSGGGGGVGMTKLVVAVPAEGKLFVCDVWSGGKKRELKRQPSFLSSATIR